MNNPAVPGQVGKYLIQRLLGEGAMGSVYQAHDPVIDRDVAIKTIHGHLLQGDKGEQLRARFVQEAKAAGRCIHPHIVALFDYGEAEGTPYLAMEFVRGRTLRQVLDTTTGFSPESAARIVVQVLDALAFAHEYGIVHRDMKPANVMLLDSGRVKVMDFGVARLDASDLTQTGMVVGTAGYMAPEQITGQPVGPRTDLFAVGALLHELLTGERAFHGRGATAVAYQVMNEWPAPVSQINPRVPASLDAVVQRALAKKPDERFASAAAFARALATAVGAATPQTQAEGGAETTVALTSALADAAAAGMAEPGAVPQLTGDCLQQLEARLTEYLGPMARVLVKRAAARCHDPGELCRELAERIPDEVERRQFLSAARRLANAAGSTITTGFTGSSGPRGSDLGSGPQVLSAPAIPAPELARVERELTHYLGPMARVLVKRHARRINDLGELYDTLAQQLDDPRERRAFLKGRPG